ncbi:MMPL family transporter [Streptomyces aurantiacus]|uniref:Putative membrane protein YdfJ n=1 Tax=Streptomyces aurantiacus JA 4570 TaxID=1286094 RepID=S3Z9E2_9ACTN|nr:MMPL family transporter [Streptomyces aurantiacus]EPH39748.1 putative membrane protein YdfJ [Streptomyces aurantiacus JA 4570]
MASLLARLGRTAFRRRRLVLSLWLAVLAAAIACLTAFGSGLDDEFSIPGSESQRALDTMAEEFPAAAGTSAQLVFTAPEGKKVTDAPYAAVVTRTLAEVGRAPQVAAVVDPAAAGTVSADGRTALAQAQYEADRSALRSDALPALEKAADRASEDGLEVTVGGNAYGSGGVSVSAKEAVGAVVALVVLALTFGSLLAAGMPLLSALVGVAVGLCGLLAVTGAVGISSTAVTLALMLGLAVGIDYALFILSRHRSQLADGMDPEESAARANGTSGSAVVFAGLTVVIALAGLAVVRIPFLTVMGLSAAATVLVAVLVAVTLLPALLGFAGTRLAPRPGSRAARRANEAESAPTWGERWVRTATRRPLLTVLATVAALAAVAVPAKDLRLALPDNGSAPSGSSQRQTYDTVSDAFGPGFNGPLLVLAQPSGHDAAAPRGREAAARIAAELKQEPGVAAVSPPRPAKGSADAIIQVVPETGPDDEATKDLVHRLRDRAPELHDRTGAAVSVTGSTAVGVDVSDRLGDSLLPFAAVVVGLCLLLLLLVFRSLVVPVKATFGFLLSVAASFGAVAAVFQWGWLADQLGVARTGPVVSFLPIVLMAVLFGLAMDYEVFLVSSVREEYTRTGRARDAVRLGARHAARVVTAAALIMFAVFASFVSMDDAIVKPIAFALAFGVLIDAFVIRMTFVPAVLALVGDGAWWLPRWLERVLPHVDIEGEKPAPGPAAAGDVPEPEPARG